MTVFLVSNDERWTNLVQPGFQEARTLVVLLTGLKKNGIFPLLFKTILSFDSNPGLLWWIHGRCTWAWVCLANQPSGPPWNDSISVTLNILSLCPIQLNIDPKWIANHCILSFMCNLHHIFWVSVVHIHTSRHISTFDCLVTRKKKWIFVLKGNPNFRKTCRDKIFPTMLLSLPFRWLDVHNKQRSIGKK